MLRFLPRTGHMQPLPNQSASAIRRYYGLDSKPKKDANGKLIGIEHVAQEKPFEVEEGTYEAFHLMRIVKLDHSVLPADEHTARMCGVNFVQPAKDAKSGAWDLPSALIGQKTTDSEKKGGNK